MTKTLSKFLIFILFTLFFSEKLLSNEIIIPYKKPDNLVDLGENFVKPEKKPGLTDLTKYKIKKKSFLLPEKKPSKVVLEEVKTSEIQKKIVEEVAVTADQEAKIILPEKKPITYKKKIEKIAKKSEYFSKKDFKLSQKIFTNVDKRKWTKALNLAKKAENRSLYKLVKWLYLLERNNQATFYDYINFINLNPSYPRLGRLRYLAEHKITIKSVDTNRIIKFFSDQEPSSGYGKLILGNSYIENGNIQKGEPLIKEGWITAKLSKKDLRFFKKKLKKYLNTEDHIKRADWLAWENKYWDLKRMLRYLPEDYQALYNARQLLMSKSYGVDAAISKVPKKFIKDHGLQYERLKWRRKRGRLDSSLEILLEIKNNPIDLVRPEKWWIERAIISRSLIYKKKYTLAYKIASNHSLVEGPEYAEAEWMSGWIALSFLNDPILANQHFHNFYHNVGYPISLSRGAYWIGRSYEDLDNKLKSEEWYSEGAKYLTTYYGQLSFIKINGNSEFSLPPQMSVSKDLEKEFMESELYKLVVLLHEINKTKYTKHILKHLATTDIDDGSEILAGKLAVKIGRYDYAVQIAKKASYEKRFHNNLNYPIIGTPKIINGKKMPSADLILAIIRQESEFDAKANSHAGAKGMMQLMTYTARLVAKQAKLPYSKSRLTSDPDYNIELGSYYITGLLEEYEGSYPFSIAAYNAGPKRVRYWKKINGDPQKGKINYVDWIELIKFKETRNYVQRVLENINVYKYMLSKKPIKIHNFFYDKPHF